MISALDSSVILDVVTNDRRHADASAAVIRQALDEGQLVVCNCVLTEVRPAFNSDSDFTIFLNDWDIAFVPDTQESAMEAGRLFRTYLERGGKAGRIVADFLIGAHASNLADRLVARDRGYLRDYFKSLKLLVPSSA